jgi:coproporphyrinogen III oxidase-like Fe-S oxidoreductase
MPPPARKLELLELTIRRLTEAGYVYIGMDHFALPDDELAWPAPMAACNVTSRATPPMPTAT